MRLLVSFYVQVALHIETVELCAHKGLMQVQQTEVLVHDEALSSICHVTPCETPLQVALQFVTVKLVYGHTNVDIDLHVCYFQGAD